MLAFEVQKLNSYSQMLHDQGIASARRYLVAEADLLAAIILIDKDETYKKLRYEHLSPYCVKELGLSEEVAGTFVRVARKCHECPSLLQAVKEEGLHLTKAKTIVSVLTPENQTEWIAMAQSTSKANLEKQVAIVNPSPHRVEKAKPVGENRHRIEFELNDQNMELQQRARDIVSQKLGHSASLAETQQYLLENFLKHEDPVVKADRAEKRIRERSQERPKDCSKQLSPDRSQKLTNKKVEKVQDNAQYVLKKGQRFRDKGHWSHATIPGSVRHQVFLRDRGCCQAMLPDGSLCLKQRWIHLHHIIHKANGGKDTLENLVTLCSYHHRLCH